MKEYKVIFRKANNADWKKQPHLRKPVLANLLKKFLY